MSDRKTEVIKFNIWKYIDIEILTNDLHKNPDVFTPWFKMEWQRLTGEYMDRIHSLFR